jgi:hypothetical protein
MTRAILIAASLYLAGCTSFLEPASEEIARGIVRYCDEEPVQSRLAYRNAIRDDLPEGYEVHVHCPGDPE